MEGGCNSGLVGGGGGAVNSAMACIRSHNNGIACSAIFVNFFSPLDPDPHIPCGSGRPLLMRIHADPDLQHFRRDL